MSEIIISDFYDYEYDDLKDILKDNQMDYEIGVKVFQQDIDKIVEIVNQTLNEQDDSKLNLIKDKYVANFGMSAKIIADYLIQRNKELEE